MIHSPQGDIPADKYTFPGKRLYDFSIAAGGLPVEKIYETEKERRILRKWKSGGLYQRMFQRRRKTEDHGISDPRCA
jgi:hypothetical protein